MQSACVVFKYIYSSSLALSMSEVMEENLFPLRDGSMVTHNAKEHNDWLFWMKPFCYALANIYKFSLSFTKFMGLFYFRKIWAVFLLFCF